MKMNIQYLFFFIVFSCHFHATTAQQQINWESKKISKLADFTDYLPSENVFFIANKFEGFLHKTFDNGKTWYSHEYNFSGSITAMAFASKDTGFVATSDNLIYRTVNGGQSFQVANYTANKMIENIEYKNGIGYAFHSRDINFQDTTELYKSYDGGDTWSFASLAKIDLSVVPGKVQIINNNVAYISGSSYFNNTSSLQKTIDGGQTWLNVPLPFFVGIPAQMDFYDENNGMVQLYGNSTAGVYKTSNGGNTWQLMPSMPFNVNELKYLDANTIFYTSPYRDTLYKSIDGGNTWSSFSQNASNSTNKLNLELHYFSQADCFLSGDSEAFFHSNDLGLNWEKTYSFSNNVDMKAVGVVSDSVLIAVGYNSSNDNTLIMRSTNGGRGWQKMQHDFTTTIGLNGVHFPSENIGYAVGSRNGSPSNRTVLKTTDGGLSWTNTFSNSLSGEFANVYFVDDLIGYCIGYSGVISKTTDGGSSWVSQTSNITTLLKDIHFFTPNEGIIAANYTNKIIKTFDGGNTWTLIPNTYSISKMKFASDSTGYIFGTSAILKTTDRGNTWTNVFSVPATAIACSGSFKNEVEGYAVTWDSNNDITIFSTKDGGSTWSNHPSNYGIGNYYDFINDSTFLCVSSMLATNVYDCQNTHFVNKTICQGESYLGHTVSGAYSDLFYKPNGCDSLRVLILSVLPTIQKTIQQSICQGENYDGYTTNGTYVDTLMASSGCDSIRTLQLTVLNHFSSTIQQTICSNEDYDGYNSSGVYLDTLVSYNGCDSFRTLTLNVLPAYYTSIDTFTCHGNSFMGYNSTGNHINTYTSVNGCDSIIEINLSVSDISLSSVTIHPDFGNNDGSISVTASGGISSYNFSWDNGLTGSSINNLSFGTYILSVTDALGCLDTFHISIDNRVSTHQQILEANITISPNPVSPNQNLSIQYDGKEAIQSIEIFDIKGRLIDIYSLNNETQFIKKIQTNLVKGLYFIRLTSNNQKIKTIKVEVL